MLVVTNATHTAQPGTGVAHQKHAFQRDSLVWFEGCPQSDCDERFFCHHPRSISTLNLASDPTTGL